MRGVATYTMDSFRNELVQRGVVRRKKTPGPKPQSKRALRGESWPMACKRLVEAAEMRLVRLDPFPTAHFVACPWCAMFGPCASDGRCQGFGRVAIGELRRHCEGLIAEFGVKP